MASTKSNAHANIQCPICNMSLSTKQFDGNEAAREAHVNACLGNAQDSSTSFDAEKLPPGYHMKDGMGGGSTNAAKRQSVMFEKFKEASEQASSKGKEVMKNGDEKTAPGREDQEVSALRRFFSSLLGESKSADQKRADNVTTAGALMRQKWGPEDSPTFTLVMKYIVATRMQEHWEYLGSQHPRQFKRHLYKGYMEPIPTAWVINRKLAYLYPEGSYWEGPAEKRLYYLLNNGVLPDGTKHARMRPLNIIRDRNTIIRRGNERNARQQHLDVTKLAAYQSAGDVFHGDKQTKSHVYSDQVPNVVYEARQQALHELADGILHGTDHLETMLLIDVSGSMTWNPHQGVVGPDGIRRFHDQPPNIQLVEHLVHRVLHHMVPRAQRQHPYQHGIDTVTFSSRGNHIGELSADNFRHDWQTKVRLGGGTQVMMGWQQVKNTYFRHIHESTGHGRLDPVFGWQATPGMPKLSLLVFLDGEANDMDEFELELLGETWAYVTIALVGMENCPHHHSHAIELERVAKFNPHVGFFDVHGRVCERMVVEDLLDSVYPVDPPQYSEILRPEYDLKAEELPASIY